jgi:hypothetical protein
MTAKTVEKKTTETPAPATRIVTFTDRHTNSFTMKADDLLAALSKQTKKVCGDYAKAAARAATLSAKVAAFVASCAARDHSENDVAELTGFHAERELATARAMHLADDAMQGFRADVLAKLADASAAEQAARDAWTTARRQDKAQVQAERGQAVVALPDSRSVKLAQAELDASIKTHAMWAGLASATVPNYGRPQNATAFDVAMDPPWDQNCLKIITQVFC